MLVKNLGLVPYSEALIAMRAFTDARNEDTPDEIWCLEHPAVFTLGQAALPEHILASTNIPIVQSCRGGQVTYHGPGQLIIYPLLDLRRYDLNVKTLVFLLEEAVLRYLRLNNIEHGNRKPGAPGIYIGEKKIACLGLRIRRGYSYHGLSFNINMDLSPFEQINPCGFKNLTMCQIKDFIPNITIESVQTLLLSCFLGVLNEHSTARSLS